jgi:Saxitoxin biosynthesis operon protein SxtJ
VLDPESQPTDAGSTPRQLREFALAWLVFFSALGARHWIRHHDVRTLAAYTVVAVSVGVTGLAAPRVVKPLFSVAMAISLPIGWVMTRLALGLLFFGLFAPVAWIFRRVRRDRLVVRRIDTSTYWTAAPPPTDARSSFRQSL